MKRFFRPLVILTAALLALPVAAQFSATQAFTSAPRRIIPPLENMTRLDMVDYFQSGYDKPSMNALEGKSRVTAITPMKLDIELSELTHKSFVLLPTANDTLVAIITTVATPGTMSFLKVYDRNWNPVDNAMTEPTLAQWVTKEGKSQMTDIENAFAFIPVEMDYNPDTQTLTLTSTIAQTAGEEEYNKYGPMILPKLTYRWNGKRMEMTK